MRSNETIGFKPKNTEPEWKETMPKVNHQPAWPAMEAAILNWSHDRERSLGTSCDPVTSEQFNLKRGEKDLRGKQKVSLNNKGKMRERDSLKLTPKGRGADPDQKWPKQRRQTFSLRSHYNHVEYQVSRNIATMGTVCNYGDLEKTGGNRE